MAKNKEKQEQEKEKCNCLNGEECGCETNKCDCNEEFNGDHNGQHLSEEMQEGFSCDANGCGVKKVDYLAMAQRVQADFDNFKRRTQGIALQSFQDGIFAAVSKILPALDSFEQAKEKVTDKSSLEGLNLIFEQLTSALKSVGVNKIECVNKNFNPKYHNAVLVDNEISGNEQGQIVVEQLQAGYMLGDKVIRHSVVKVSKE